jgi:hypothetical protein
MIVTDVVFSGRASVRFDYGPDAASMREASIKQFNMPSSASTLVVSARIRFVSGSAAELDVKGTTSCLIAWSVPGHSIGAWFCPGYEPPPSLTGIVPPDAWSIVSLSITRPSADVVHVQSIVGEGNQALTYDFDVGTDGGSPLDTPISLQLGNGGSDGTGTVYYDDVLVQAF